MRSFMSAAIAGACLAALAIPAHASAQGLKVNPRVGVYVPLTELGELSGETVELNNSLALGLGVEFGVPFLPFNVRANIDYASDASVTTEGLDRDAGRTTLLAVVGDAVLRFPRAVLVQPYAFAGGGLKQYAFDTDRPEEFRDSSDPTVHLGAGLDFGFSGFSLNAEVADYISWYELRGGDSTLQHDVFLTIGVAVTMF